MLLSIIKRFSSQRSIFFPAYEAQKQMSRISYRPLQNNFPMNSPVAPVRPFSWRPPMGSSSGGGSSSSLNTSSAYWNNPAIRLSFPVMMGNNAHNNVSSSQQQQQQQLLQQQRSASSSLSSPFINYNNNTNNMMNRLSTLASSLASPSASSAALNNTSSMGPMPSSTSSALMGRSTGFGSFLQTSSHANSNSSSNNYSNNISGFGQSLPTPTASLSHHDNQTAVAASLYAGSSSLADINAVTNTNLQQSDTSSDNSMDANATSASIQSPVNDNYQQQQQQQQSIISNIRRPSHRDRMIASFVREMTALAKDAATPLSGATIEVQTSNNSNDIIILDDSDED